MSLSVTINGDPRQVEPGQSLFGMLAGLGIDPVRVAVERNLEIVPRSTFDRVAVEDGDQFEIVHFVGGG